MPPRKDAAADEESASLVRTGKRKRTTVKEADAAAAAASAAASAAAVDERAAKKPRKTKTAPAASVHVTPAAAAPKRARTAASAAAASVDRYPDKTIPQLLGCAHALRSFCLSYPSAFESFPWVSLFEASVNAATAQRHLFPLFSFSLFVPRAALCSCSCFSSCCVSFLQKHRVFKVGSDPSGKIFAYLHGEAGVNVSLGLKLPTSGKKLVKEKNFVGQCKGKQTGGGNRVGENDSMAVSPSLSLTHLLMLFGGYVLSLLVCQRKWATEWENMVGWVSLHCEQHRVHSLH
jgi:hypothetical protein